MAGVFLLFAGCAHNNAQDAGHDQTNTRLDSNEWTALSKGTEVRILPTNETKSIYQSKSGDTVKKIKREGDWVAVLDQDGMIGWIHQPPVDVKEPTSPMALVEDPVSPPPHSESIAAVEREEPPPVSVTTEESEEPTPESVRSTSSARGDSGFNVNLDASLGSLFKTQKFNSAGTGINGNYKISTMSPTINLDLSIVRKLSTFSFGMKAYYRKTLDGGVDTPAGSGKQKLSWGYQSMDIRLLMLYSFKGTWSLKSHLGTHRSTVDIGKDNTALFPSETISGMALGIGVIVPFAQYRMRLSVDMDYLLSGDLDQAKGLRDGSKVDLTGQYIRVVAIYQWKPALSLNWEVVNLSESIDFSGPSERNPGVNSGNRSDSTQIYSMGVSYRF